MTTPGSGLTRVGDGYYADPTVVPQTYVHTPHVNAKCTRYVLPLIALLAMSELPKTNAGPVSWAVWLTCMGICLAATKGGFWASCATTCAMPERALAIAGL